MRVTISALVAFCCGAKWLPPMPETRPASCAAATYASAHAGISFESAKVVLAFGSTVKPSALTRITVISVLVSGLDGRSVLSS
ncbi:hypothetical protein D3C78_1469410 [compost metagenome]